MVNQKGQAFGFMRYLYLPRFFIVIVLCTTFVGCAALTTQKLAVNLSHAMLNQDDPDTVRSGAAAYLLLIDSLIEDQPKDQSLLLAGAQLYNAYASGLVKDTARAKRLSQRARNYARLGLCEKLPQICTGETQPYDQFAPMVNSADRTNLKALYVYGTSWAGWIQARRDSWEALADLAKVEAVLERVVELDPAYARGRAQLYLGVMRTQLPPALGGKPEAGRIHFDLAIKHSAGRDLMAKVEYARRYARLVFKQKLHDRLLHEVLAADPIEYDLTLSNVLAQEMAQELLAEDYF